MYKRQELIGRPDADTAEFEVESGKGVYMRALARDLSAACGTVGHIVVLRRLRVGPFLENMAVSMDTILDPAHTPSALAELVRPLETALDDIPALALTAAEAHALSQGQPINLVDLMGRIPDAANPDEGLVRVLAAGRVLAPVSYTHLLLNQPLRLQPPIRESGQRQNAPRRQNPDQPVIRIGVIWNPPHQIDQVDGLAI